MLGGHFSYQTLSFVSFSLDLVKLPPLQLPSSNGTHCSGNTSLFCCYIRYLLLCLIEHELTTLDLSMPKKGRNSRVKTAISTLPVKISSTMLSWCDVCHLELYQFDSMYVSFL